MATSTTLRRPIRWLVIGECLFLLAVSGTAAVQVRLIEQKITEMADLKDPSPFTSTLFLHLQQIHLDLLAYVQTHDPQILEKLKAAQTDFNNSVDQFHQLNPRLFPDAARDRIQKAYQPLQLSLDTLLPISDAQSTKWTELLQNNDLLMSHLELHLRPLIRPSQPMYLQRLDLTINLQTLVRAVPRHLTQYVLGLQAGEGQEREIAQDDNKFERFLRLYQRMAVLEAERKTLLAVEGLWTENSELASRIIEMDKAKSAAYTAMLNSSSALQSTISDVLPAVRPEVIDQKKSAIFRTITLMMVSTGLLVLLGIGSMIYSALGIYRRARDAQRMADAVGESTLSEETQRADGAGLEARIRINLKGSIVRWLGDAPELYGYESDDVMGQSVGMLFASSAEIRKLYEGLKSGKQAEFETSHLGKGQRPVRVHIRFSPVLDAKKKIQGIDLAIQDLSGSSHDAAA